MQLRDLKAAVDIKLKNRNEDEDGRLVGWLWYTTDESNAFTMCTHNNLEIPHIEGDHIEDGLQY